MTKPVDTGSHINWDPNLSFDPTDASDPFATHGIPIPTYGNYGGPGYTAGTLGGTTPNPPPDPAPVDALDALFYQHDLVLQKVIDGLLPPAAAVGATVELVTNMAALPNIDPDDAHYDPSVGLYEGLATLAVVNQLLVATGAWDFLDDGTKGAIAAASQEAVKNFEAGLAAIPGEAGSLHGALHVFEHKFAPLLPFELVF